LIQPHPHGFNDAAQNLDLVTALICKDLQKLTNTIAIASVPYDARSDQEWLYSIGVESRVFESNER
jgi:predicted secreted protein